MHHHRNNNTTTPNTTHSTRLTSTNATPSIFQKKNTKNTKKKSHNQGKERDTPLSRIHHHAIQNLTLSAFPKIRQ
jgi:hypothetical protein